MPRGASSAAARTNPSSAALTSEIAAPPASGDRASAPAIASTRARPPAMHENRPEAQRPAFHPASHEIFQQLTASAAAGMGVTRGRTAYTPSTKERKHYLYADFHACGRLIPEA